MTTTTPRQELTQMIAMLTEAIEFCKAEGEDYSRQAEVLAQYEARLASMVGDGGIIRIDHTEARNLLSRPEGGKAHRNQYGPCQVAYATDKQQAFALSLFDSRDLTKLTTGVTALDLVATREALVARKINKKAISTLIDRLLGCPEKATATPAFSEKASDKQIALIKRLAGEKEMSADDRAKVLAAVDTLSKKGASATIDKMFALPKATAPVTQIEAGVYTDGKTVTYRVYLGQQSGQMLAARVVEHVDGTAEFIYEGKADRLITSAFRKLTIEEAAHFGRSTGTCIVCARRLDVPESVDRGIGPVCFAKMGG